MTFERSGTSDWYTAAFSDLYVPRYQHSHGAGMVAINAGHLVHASKPEEFINTVVAFLSERGQSDR